MSTNRAQYVSAVARLAAVLLALAAAVTLTSVAAAGPEAAKQRVAITQKVVVTHAIFAKLKARPAPPGKPVTASGSFTVDEFKVGPIGGEHCAPPPQTCAIGTLLDKGTVTSSYAFVGKPGNVHGRGTVRGTATATGKGGSVTWQFSAPTGAIVPLNARRPKGGIGPPAPIVGTGKALVTNATGDLAQLEGKKGLTAFYFDAATGWLRVSALL